MTKADGSVLNGVTETSEAEAVRSTYPILAGLIARRDTKPLSASYDHVRALRPRVAPGTALRQALDDLLAFLDVACGEIEKIECSERLRSEVESIPLWGKILQALESAKDGLSQADLAARVGEPDGTVRGALEELLARELVESWSPSLASRRTWALACAGKKVQAARSSASAPSA